MQNQSYVRRFLPLKGSGGTGLGTPRGGTGRWWHRSQEHWLPRLCIQTSPCTSGLPQPPDHPAALLGSDVPAAPCILPTSLDPLPVLNHFCSKLITFFLVTSSSSSSSSTQLSIEIFKPDLSSGLPPTLPLGPLPRNGISGYQQ